MPHSARGSLLPSGPRQQRKQHHESRFHRATWRAGGPPVRRPARPGGRAGRGGGRHRRRQRQRRRLEGARRRLRPIEVSLCAGAGFFRRGRRASAKACRIFASAMRCSACARPARRAPMPRRSRSRPPSSPRNPTRLSHVEAAALALTGLTAMSAVEETLKLEPGETILIQGGAGGVASFAIQLAKHIGARVITTASAANHDYLRALGADEVIDYNAARLHARRWPTATPCSTPSAATWRESPLRCSSRAAAPPSSRPGRRRRSPSAPTSRRCGRRSGAPAATRAHRRAVPGGRDPRAGDHALPPREAAAAHRVSEARHLRGKLVLQVR